MKALWGGRFVDRADDFFVEFNRSLPFDYRLFDADVRCSIAYAGGLLRAGILTDSEYNKMVEGLETLLQRAEKEEDFLQNGIKEGFEDIHAFVEARLGELVGSLAKKLHTGRSRNDQVATDFRYYVRERINESISLIEKLQKALVAKGQSHADAMMPGYTHLQRAQPILFGHFCLSFFEMLQRDKERLKDCYKRVNILPLGSGALAGNNHAVDRKALAKELSFSDVTRNSLDATSDRDFVVEYVQNASLCMVHLSRLAEDLIIYSSHEFGFVKMSDKVSTGSSLMPQKKNPDALELIRGKSGRVFGHVTSLLSMMKGLPSCYNKDMQEDKEPLFDTAMTLAGCLEVMTTVVESMAVNEKAMKDATDGGYLNATDLADYLVAKGIPFREAHHLVGEIVTKADGMGVALEKLPLEVYKSFHQDICEGVYAAIDLKKTISAKSSFGGTAPSRVSKALESAMASL